MHLTWLSTFGEVKPFLSGITAAKIQHFAAEAKAQDASELKKIARPKRITLILCLIYSAQVATRDNLVSMFLKRMGTIHHKAKEELEKIRSARRETTEKLVGVLTSVLQVFVSEPVEGELREQLDSIIAPNGGVQQLLNECESLNAYAGNNYLPLLWRFYKSHRSAFFRLLSVLKFESTTAEQNLIEALKFLLDNEHRRGEWLPNQVDLSFANARWQKLIVNDCAERTGEANRGKQTFINRRHFEVCVFSYLAAELKSGDICVIGSGEYANYREQLLSWSECQPLVAQYCNNLGLPTDAEGFVAQLKSTLTETANRVDSGYPDNGQVVINEKGAVYILEGLLKNKSDIQPHTIHADTQGQSTPVFALAHLLGIKLMPRIRNWQDLIFYRPDSDSVYQHIDLLFKEAIDWERIANHWQDLMRVVLSIASGKISSSVLLRKLGNYSRKNRLYQAFQELGRAVRTIFLLQYISDIQLRQQITAATNKVESYHGFSKWFFFGGFGVIAHNDPEEQEKIIKYNDLIANAVVFHNVVDLTEVLRQLRREGYIITREDVAILSPYMTSHIKRFGDYLLDLKQVPQGLDELTAFVL